MKFHFVGEVSKFLRGIEIHSQTMNFEIDQQGREVKIERTSEALIEVVAQKNNALIRCHKDIHFFRGLSLLIEGLQKSEEFHIVEKPQFHMNGGMFDCSRNAVMKVETAKRLIRNMSLMGLNLFMLYTEDTYTIEDEPLFGYMRGRYTYHELKEIDDYADIFGIEVIPCIQTLAHLSTFLQWNAKKDLMDTESILLTGAEKTYELIDKMVHAASKPFRTHRIHIGMDEAHGLGKGRYLDKFGPKRSFDIMTDHLNQVLNITDKYGLKPIIWSDMYFRFASSDQEYYDLNAEIPSDVIKKVPKNLNLVYWDYYHNDQAFYEKYIEKHNRFQNDVLFAGATWGFTSIATNYEKTFLSTNAALTACKSKGVKEVFTTMWLDNGAENSYFSGLLGLQLYAEHGYAKTLDLEKLIERFTTCTGGKFHSFMNLGKPELPPKAEWKKERPDNPAKFLLWQDLLLGLFDKHIDGLDLKGYYSQLEKKLKLDIAQNPVWKPVFEVPANLCSVLSLKSDMGVQIKKAYDKNNIQSLKNICEKDLPELINRVQLLRIAHRDQWFAYNKPFGWEILDLRYGGLIARLETVSNRLQSFINGSIKNIEELEEEKVFYDNLTGNDIGRNTLYHKIVSTNVL